MKIFIENPAGTKVKKEFLVDTKEWVPKPLMAVPYLYPYGFIPNTLQDDGDPLDAFLITDKNRNRGKTIEINVIGLVEFYEDDKRDFKILTKPLNESRILSSEVKERLTYFMLHAFDNNPEKTVKIGKFHSKNKALEEIEKCAI
jgi:inorganic pyrophosphatase